jgi:uncharacterized protein
MANKTRADGKRGLPMWQRPLLGEAGWRPGWSSDARDGDADTTPALERWVPSRFNVRARDDRGHLILWNTLTNSISAFNPEQAETIVPMLERHGLDSPRRGMVEYLVQRGFLVQSGTDEYRRFQAAFDRQHQRTDRLELILLAAEDRRSGEDRGQDHRQDDARGVMTREIRQGIRRMVEQRIEALQSLDVSWFGGEPLHGWAAIEELAPFLAELAEEHGVAYTGSMTTRGHLLTPEVVDALLAWKIDTFRITLDAPSEIHHRPARGQGGFETVFRNLEAMVRRHDCFRVLLRVNYDRTSAGRIDELLARVEETLGEDPRFELRFRAVDVDVAVHDVEDERQSSPERCGLDEQRRLLARLEAAARARGLRFGTLRQVSQVGGQACHAARPYSFVIGARGQIMKCTVALDRADHNVIGHLTETGEMVLDRDRLARWTAPAFEQDAQCQRCMVLPNCQGIACPLVRIETGARWCAPTRRSGKRMLHDLFRHGRDQARRKTIDTAVPIPTLH